LTYTFTNLTTGCSNSNSDEIEVFAVPAVNFTAPADLCVNSGVQSNLGGGLPTGGIYSGAGVSDDGNGMTYSFDPSDAGIGAHTLSYSVPGNNSCTGVASDEVNVNSCSGTVTWDGSESSSWSVAGNWDSNAVPSAMDVVIIPEVATNDPIIANGVTGLSKSLSITSDGFLIIENGGILTIMSDVDPLTVDVTGKLTVESGGQLDANL